MLLQVTFSLPQQMRDVPLIYSGYLTATPLQAAPGKINTEKAHGQHKQYDKQYDEQYSRRGAKRLTSLAGFTGVLPYRPVPLVVPYQGFSQNYTTLPLLPQPNAKDYPHKTKVGLQSLLRVCYADLAYSFYDEAESDVPINQDGFLYQAHVDRCIYNAVDPTQTYKLPMKMLQDGEGVVMIAAALNRPAVRMQLMLFEAVPCKDGASKAKQGSATAASGCVGGKKRGALLGEVWRYLQPSRDYPTTLWSYYNYDFGGLVSSLEKPLHDGVLCAVCWATA